MKTTHMKTETKTMLDTYVEMLKNSVDGKGIYPLPAIILTAGGTVSMMSLMVTPEQAYEAVRKAAEDDYKEILVGLDRMSRAGQGIPGEFDSVFTFAHIKNGEGFAVGCLPYTSDPRNIGEIQWDNEFWIPKVTQEIKAFGFIDPDATDEIIGAAYENKLKVTHVRKTSSGQKYEGIVDFDKLSPDVQKFFEMTGMDVNDRKTVINFFKEQRIRFDYEYKDLGFVTLMAGNGLFPARSSKSKLYIEGVESIVKDFFLPKEA